MVVNAFIFTEALDEAQIRFIVLNAVVPFGIEHRSKVETMAIASKDAVLIKHLRNDLRYRELLEDALVGAV